MFLFRFFTVAMVLLLRVPLRLIVGREERNRIVKRIPFYRRMHMEYTNWGYNEDYEGMYGSVDYEGKTVLDVGAEHGSTAEFFLGKGAEFVVAVEGSLEHYSQLQRNIPKLGNVKPMRLWVNCARDFEDLLDGGFDVVKVDCEGCERFLLEVDREKFRKIQYYIVETHTGRLLKKFMDKFSECGYIVLSVQELHKNPVVTVIHAEKAGYTGN